VNRVEQVGIIPQRTIELMRIDQGRKIHHVCSSASAAVGPKHLDEPVRERWRSTASECRSRFFQSRSLSRPHTSLRLGYRAEHITSRSNLQSCPTKPPPGAARLRGRRHPPPAGEGLSRQGRAEDLLLHVAQAVLAEE
jgi:hypothetical protein